MSEDSETSKQPKVDKVTSVEKTEKVKDPRKVELGKRLAKISREAKERKAKLQSEVENRERTHFTKEINDYVDFRYFVGGVTVVAALGGLYYAYKRDKRQSEELKRSEQSESDQSESDQSERERKDKKVKTINKNDYIITKCKPSKCSIENL